MWCACGLLSRPDWDPVDTVQCTACTTNLVPRLPPSPLFSLHTLLPYPLQAALEAISGVDLFGSHGGPSSVIHVMYDQVAQCNVRLSGTGGGLLTSSCLFAYVLTFMITQSHAQVYTCIHVPVGSVTCA